MLRYLLNSIVLGQALVAALKRPLYILYNDAFLGIGNERHIFGERFAIAFSQREI